MREGSVFKALQKCSGSCYSGIQLILPQHENAHPLKRAQSHTQELSVTRSANCNECTPTTALAANLFHSLCSVTLPPSLRHPPLPPSAIFPSSAPPLLTRKSVTPNHSCRGCTAMDQGLEEGEGEGAASSLLLLCGADEG